MIEVKYTGDALWERIDRAVEIKPVDSRSNAERYLSRLTIDIAGGFDVPSFQDEV